jgi:hypothetical protein
LQKINTIKTVNSGIETSLKGLTFEIELAKLEENVAASREAEATQTTLNS